MSTPRDPIADLSRAAPDIHLKEEEREQPLQGIATEEALAPQIAPTTAEMPRVLRAFRNRDYRWFWTGNFLSNTGTWMQNVAQGWLVLQLVDAGARAVPELGGLERSAAFWLGVIGFATSAPMLGFSLIGGVIADRVDRRQMLMRAQAAMMVFALILALLTALKVVTIPAVVLLAFATGMAMSLAMPSYQAMVPQLVPREDLTNAIGLNSSQFNLARFLGPSIGGFTMAWFGIAGNFLLNALSYLAVIIALSRIRYVQPVASSADSATLWQRLAEGFRYVYDRRIMFSLLSVVGLASTFGIPYLMFIPLFARNILGLSERGFGLLMASAGLGSFFGAITIAALGNIRRRGRFIALSALAFFLAVILFSLSKSVLFSGAMLMLAGYSMILMVATVNTSLQHLSSDTMRGRVMSIYAMAFLGFAPVGSLIAGSLAGAVTAPYAIAGMSGFALLASLALYLARPELRQLD